MGGRISAAALAALGCLAIAAPAAGAAERRDAFVTSFDGRSHSWFGQSSK